MIMYKNALNIKYEYHEHIYVCNSKMFQYYNIFIEIYLKIYIIVSVKQLNTITKNEFI